VPAKRRIGYQSGAPFCHSSANSQIQREGRPFRHEAADVFCTFRVLSRHGCVPRLILAARSTLALVLRMRGENPRRMNRLKPSSG
jgi:hypothetical protein